RRHTHPATAISAADPGDAATIPTPTRWPSAPPTPPNPTGLHAPPQRRQLRVGVRGADILQPIRRRGTGPASSRGTLGWGSNQTRHTAPVRRHLARPATIGRRRPATALPSSPRGGWAARRRRA